MRDGHSRSLRYLKVLRARRRDRFAMGGGTGQGLGGGRLVGWLQAFAWWRERNFGGFRTLVSGREAAQ
jgi:hypothetical protein